MAAGPTSPVSTNSTGRNRGHSSFQRSFGFAAGASAGALGEGTGALVGEPAETLGGGSAGELCGESAAREARARREQRELYG